MSSILKAINEEASEIDQLQRKLDNVESVLGTRTDRNGRLYNQYVNDVTKPIKWLSNDGLVSDIHSGLRQLAEKIGMAEERMEDEEDAVREAWNQLESAVYGLAEPFEEYVRDLQYKVEEMQMDIDDKKYELQDEPLDEVKYVDGFMGADGKPTSRPTAKDYASNKEFQHMKKKLGDRIPQPTKRDKNGKLSPFKKDEQVDESKMGDLHLDIQQGATAKDLVRDYKMSLEQAKEFLRDYYMDKKSRTRNDPKEVKETEFDDAFNNIFKSSKPGEGSETMKRQMRTGRSGPKGPRYDRSHSHRNDYKRYKDDFKKSELDFELGHEDLEEKKKSGMAQVMEIYEDHAYLMYINGKLASPTPIDKKHKNAHEREVKIYLPDADVQFKAVAKGNYSAEELAEGNGNIRKALAGIILLSGLLGLNNYQAQKMYDKSHQLQQLTQVYLAAKDCGDEVKMKDVRRRIGNHKTRLDIGKGDVDFDGRPGDDDIKDIDYINQSCEVR